jgi:hypothetical protein
MRRIGSLAVSAVLVVSLASCGSGGEGAKTPTASGSPGQSGPAAGGPAAGNGKNLKLPQVVQLLNTRLASQRSVKITVASEGKQHGVLTVSTRSGHRDLELLVQKGADGRGVHVLSLKDGIYAEHPLNGKPWRKFPPKNLQGQFYRIMVTALDAFVQLAQQINRLTAGATLTNTKQNPDGTTLYRVNVDVAKAMQHIDKKAFILKNWALVNDIAEPRRRGGNVNPPAQLSAAQANTLANKFAAAMRGKPAVFLYSVDGKGNPAKLAFSFPARKDTNATLTFAEWGTAKITPPPPGQVALAPNTNTLEPGN